MNSYGYIRSGSFLAVSALMLLTASCQSKSIKALSSNFKGLSPNRVPSEQIKLSVIKNIDDYMKMEPLSEIPLVKQGLVFLYNGDLEKSLTVLEKAQAFNPRNREAAVTLMYLYLSQGELDKGLLQLELLFRLNPSKMPQYVDFLSALTQNMSNWDDLLRRIERKPK